MNLKNIKKILRSTIWTDLQTFKGSDEDITLVITSMISPTNKQLTIDTFNFVVSFGLFERSNIRHILDENEIMCLLGDQLREYCILGVIIH